MIHGPLDLELAHALAVPRHHGAVRPDQPRLDPERSLPWVSR